MAIFPLLAHPETYRACATDLLVNAEARDYWLDTFESQIETQLAAAAEQGFDEAVQERVRRTLVGELERIRRDPSIVDRLDILVLDELRDDALRSNGVTDEFRELKDRENEAAFKLLPGWLRRLDEEAMGLATGESGRSEGRFSLVIKGMLAGNIFDMGARETAGKFGSAKGAAGPGFEACLARVPSRPWLVDHVERAGRWIAANGGGEDSGKQAIVFADNAGADVVLGVFPLARALSRQGWRVILAANDAPSLNDVTADELLALWTRAQEMNPSLAEVDARIIGTGTAAPLIDLATVCDELAEAAKDCGLVVLVGMGRAIESNWRAEFTVPVLRVAMVKDQQVAKTVGGRVFDAICRFEE